MSKSGIPATEHSFIKDPPKHGQMRGHHYEDEAGQAVHVFSGGTIQSVCERYCAGCGRWIKNVGVTGELRWMANHGEHK